MNVNDYIIAECERLSARNTELARLMLAPEVTGDSAWYLRVVAEFESSRRIAELYADYNEYVEEGERLRKDFSTIDTELRAILDEEIQECERNTERTLTELAGLLTSDVKSGGAVVNVMWDNASRDFGRALSRAYSAFFANQSYSLTANATETNSTFVIEDEGAYAIMKGENGIHKASDNGRNQTVRVVVTQQVVAKAYQMNDNDIKIDVFHSSGAGGQNVNKVETAIRATHLPSGIVVMCRDERSQLRNKERALSHLREKVAAYYAERDQQTQDEERKKQSSSKSTVRSYDLQNGTVHDKRGDYTMSLSSFLRGEMGAMLRAVLLVNRITE